MAYGLYVPKSLPLKQNSYYDVEQRKITNVPEPTDDTDVVPKGFLTKKIKRLKKQVLLLDEENKHFDCNGYKVTNLGNAENDTDAITVLYLRDYLGKLVTSTETLDFRFMLMEGDSITSKCEFAQHTFFLDGKMRKYRLRYENVPTDINNPGCYIVFRMDEEEEAAPEMQHFLSESHTTAYHPQCNGKVERLHRTIKAALRTHDNLAWSETLPTVLLGLRTALQEDTNLTIAKMVYGQNIRLPGEFFCETKVLPSSETFANKLQKQMESMGPRQNKVKSSYKIFVPKDLSSCSHIFLRVDKVKKSLEPPYNGPFPVLARTEKYFTICVKGRDMTVSIDRLKPAYLLGDFKSDNFVTTQPVVTRPNISERTQVPSDIKTSRSGRIIQLPIILVKPLGQFTTDEQVPLRLAGILSFLPIIGAQLGLTMTAVGIVYTTLPFMAALARPVFGTLADKFKCWKSMTIGLLSVIGGSFFFIYLVPRFTPSLMEQDFSLQVVCTANWTAGLFPRPYNSTCLRSMLASSGLQCDAECSECNIAAQHAELEYPPVSMLNSHRWIPFCQVSPTTHYRFQATLHAPRSHQSFDLTLHGFRRFGESQQIYCEYAVETLCSVRCNTSLQRCFPGSHPPAPNIYTSARFWLYFLLLVLGWEAVGVVYSISDAICFELLGDRPDHYGKQRLWGSVGWGLMGIISGLLIEFASIDRNEINYLPAYIILLVFLAINIVVVGKLRISCPQPPTNFWRNIGEVLVAPRLGLYFIAVFFIGAFIGIQWTYEFVYVEHTLGATPLLIGLAVGVQMFLGELPFFFFSGKILERIGHYLILVVSLFAFAFRYVLYSFLYSPWFILPVEIAQGPSFGLFYASMASYAKEIAPTGMEVTMQALLGSVFDLGIAVGTLLEGVAYDRYGGRMTFRAIGVISFFLGVVYFVMHWTLQPSPRKAKNVEKAPKVQLLPEAHHLLEVSTDQKMTAVTKPTNGVASLV
ncbi:hypothetical protein LAZ67_3005446 [Cordylochernes scorpioides]|uniref:Major facilitator superfamily (MFS) profile domain-containing protein n=1 Tax=Cordylochernes scorpioides TaxID=51811 RepID=A0ABY6KB57_9ARAC|nr:hypothetical protein LAZ67_3005446 [Cordylochernes scorpioides]